MGFTRTNRVLILCFVSFCFIIVTVDSESFRNQQHRNVSFKKGKLPKQYVAESRVLDVDPPTRTFLQTILNAGGVFGLGVLWIKEVNNALSTPILTPFLLPPVILFAFAMLFMPQLKPILENALMMQIK